MTFNADRMPSLAGEVAFVLDEQGTLVRATFLAATEIEDLEREFAARGETLRWGSLDGSRVKTQLGEYFAGRRRDFQLELAPRGTDFQKAVWKQLQLITYGKTATYGEVARGLGRPKSARAIGQANNRNPIPIVIPCHRVVGADGTLTGFGGGLDAKRALLDFESGQSWF